MKLKLDIVFRASVFHMFDVRLSTLEFRMQIWGDFTLGHYTKSVKIYLLKISDQNIEILTML